MRPRRSVALLVLALLVAGCSGPDDGSPSSPATIATTATTVTTGELATVVAAPSVTSAPTATLTLAVPTSSPTAVPEASGCDTGVTLLGSTDVLDKLTYDDDAVGGLSALARVGSTAYYALSDRGGRVYALDFPVPGVPTVTGEFRLRDASGAPDTAIDGEGLAVLPNGDLLVSSELEPSIRRYTSDGQYVADLLVPDRFLVEPAGQARGNGTFESLALSPSGQRLFTAVEQPLEGDGTTDDAMSRIRILSYDLTDSTYQPSVEYLYLAEPDQDVSEMVAISDTELLVLERGLSLLTGFSARVFHVSLDDADDVSAIDRLEESDVLPATKQHLVDVADCPSGDAAVVGGINPLLENFESMALGPEQPDGSYSLIIGSDDNFQSFQVTRFLMFAIDPDQF